MVFTPKEIALILRENNSDLVKSKIKDAVLTNSKGIKI